MDNLNKLIQFLNKLETNKIFYSLSKIRDSILVSAVVPGERWEVEFMINGNVEIERFISNGEIHDETVLEELFKKFSD